MKHITLLLLALLTFISCAEEEEKSPLPAAPVITLKEEVPIYKTKIGREIPNAQISENPDRETPFNWKKDEKSIETYVNL